ncbi:hypothetical protein SCLCIDRAFT_1208320 [Scleroderma citrinum Foug A]|uniref:Uncharacterized protein n=1 Tax=Scleroderma citrinum Foug A TaxID=1036808 RepID=A0A0C3EPL5_9AGAM|nr:hypothetical protein SCLCIDRAFT_1208320 [Scleroderma citrinum Foug A]
MSPLKLEKCIRIAESEFNASLDSIAALKDSELFYDTIKDEIVARTPHTTSRGIEDILSNTSHVASVVATRIHNAYVIASGWKIVLDILRGLEKSGLKDATAHAQLRKDDGLRSRYLALWDVVNVLVDLGQMQFSVLATTTPHYSHYFETAESTKQGELGVVFDWSGLKDACKSFMDSIIIELCFPGAPYPKRILFQVLHDAVDECPREAKRFPQKMWDAVGDLSVTLELQELLESPLLGPEGAKLKASPRKMPERYELWLDAQIYSKKASESYEKFQDIINPLESTRSQAVLDRMWKAIDMNYFGVSSVFIDNLWQLEDAHRRTPQWSVVYMPDFPMSDYDSGSEDATTGLVKRDPRRNELKKQQRKLLAITDGRADDSYDDMPGLRSVSDTSDESDADYDSDDDDEGGDDDDDDETAYDEEEDVVYRNFHREAMDAARTIPEFLYRNAHVPEFDAMAEECKENPFFKILSSLQGRMFSSSAKLSATSRTEPRKGVLGANLQAVKTTGNVTPAFDIDFSNVPEDDLPPLQALATPKKKRTIMIRTTDPPMAVSGMPHDRPLSGGVNAAVVPLIPRGQRATVEDFEDEVDTMSSTSKKKKKKKKPKKKQFAIDKLATVQDDVASMANTESITLGSFAGVRSKSPSSKLPDSNASMTSLGHMSTTSLAIAPTTAKSAHAYLQELGPQKEKIKSRPHHTSGFPEKKGFLSKLSGKDQDKHSVQKDSEANVKKPSVFSRLRKKTKGYMERLLHIGDEKGGLKWENLLKIMREMGFSYDPSTAGSSVRFDPPNKADKSITIHKPHPDPTIDPTRLKKISKRLKEYYGWCEEDFLERTLNA